MPHLILEYSSNIDPEATPREVLAALHEALAKTGEFSLEDMKSRAVSRERFVVADGAPDRSFVALEIRILSGRSDEVRAAIAASALDVLVRAFAGAKSDTRCNITVQISEIDRASYRRFRPES